MRSIIIEPAFINIVRSERRDSWSWSIFAQLRFFSFSLFYICLSGHPNKIKARHLRL